VLSTIPIAVSIIGAKDVGPVTKLKLYWFRKTKEREKASILNLH
jgi:hypothetical protein